MSGREENERLSRDAKEILRGLAGERKVWPLADGQVNLVRMRLPGHLAAGIARGVDGSVWVVLNAALSDSYAHLGELLGNLPEGLDEELRELGRTLTPDPLPFDEDEEP